MTLTPSRNTYKRSVGLSLEGRQSARLVLYILPAIALMSFVFALPLVNAILQSVTAEDGTYSFASYARLLDSKLFWSVGLSTLEISVSATLFALALGYPIAYFLSNLSWRRRALVMIFVLVPFWTSILVKSFAFTAILGSSGLINMLLEAMGLQPVKLLFNRIGVTIGMSHYLIPFVIFPILTNLLSHPQELKKVAATMGAGRLRTFWWVTFPLSLPGVASGALLAFVLSLGFYVVPVLLGGPTDTMAANLIDFYAREVLDWPMASAVSVVILGSSLIFVMLLSKVPGGSSIIGGEVN